MRIVAVAWQRVRWPIVARGAARGLRGDREAIVVAVRDDSGATGLGEAAPLPGMSIDTIADAERAMTELAARLPIAIASPAAIADRITVAPAARFAIETALLVAIAQRARTCVAALLQPLPHAELRCAVVVDDADEARAAVARGARCLKIKDEPGRIEAIALAAPGVRLRIDANRRWPRGEVIDRMTALRRFPIDYIEEPCFDAHELLGSPLPCRIALDESLIALDRADLAVALASPQLAAIILKPTLLGGFARCLELAALARQHGVAPIVSHAVEGPIGFAACVELSRAIGADVPVGLAPHSELGTVSKLSTCVRPEQLRKRRWRRLQSQRWQL